MTSRSIGVHIHNLTLESKMNCSAAIFCGSLCISYLKLNHLPDVPRGRSINPCHPQWPCSSLASQSSAAPPASLFERRRVELLQRPRAMWKALECPSPLPPTSGLCQMGKRTCWLVCELPWAAVLAAACGKLRALLCSPPMFDGHLLFADGWKALGLWGGFR